MRAVEKREEEERGSEKREGNGPKRRAVGATSRLGSLVAWHWHGRLRNRKRPYGLPAAQLNVARAFPFPPGHGQNLFLVHVMHLSTSLRPA